MTAPLAVLALVATLLVAGPGSLGAAPAQAAPGGGWAQISSGGEHTCAVDQAGQAWCWGLNSHGQLGDGTTTDRSTPVLVRGLSGVAGISAGTQLNGLGGEHTCAVDHTGQVWCWGMNNYGQLGDGTTTDRLTPVRVSGLSAVADISAGTYHSCAATSAGTAHCWGANWAGQLGDGTTTARSTPVQVSGLSGVTGISGGNTHSCAVTSAGTAHCWGANSSGRLGDGTTTSRTTPVQVSGLSTVSGISAGRTHSCAVTSAGTPFCWGQNNYGQLGDGTTTDRTTPVQVSGLTGVTRISGGDFHSCAVTGAGTAYCWGHNYAGQLGDGTGWGYRTTPAAVSSLNGVVGISTGGRHSCAVTAAGEAYCWGDGQSGQLGDGSGTSRYAPVRVQDPVGNQPPWVEARSPSSDYAFGRDEAQVFSVTATDHENDAYTARVTVRLASTNTLAAQFEMSPAASGTPSIGSPAPSLGAGDYTWTVEVADPAGSGEWVTWPALPFSVEANLTPGTPTLRSPSSGATFAPEDPQVFTIRASDPDGDPYSGEIRITNSATGQTTVFATSPAASGQDSSGTPVPAVPAGSYSWQARATDALGATSPWSTSRGFTVEAEPDNQPPSIDSRSPSSGYAFGRDEPQVFSVTASDPEGDVYSGEVTVRWASNNALVTRFDTSPAASGTPSAGSPAPALGPGDYTWTVTVTDPAGSGQSVSSPALSFSVEANQAPDVPTLRSPTSGATFAPEDPQVFTIRASDPEGDAYDGTVIVRDASSGAEVARFPTAVADSGQDSTGTPAVPLSAGSYTWAAHAHDVFGATSADTAPRSFTVEEVQAPTPPPNSPPGTPTLVAPANGSSSEAGEPMVFTLRASDPDGDVYVGQVTIRDASTNVVARFDTSPAPSGSDSSGTPAEVLEPGGYTWTARAIDPAGSGSYGPTSSSRSFTVQSTPDPEPNEPPGAPTLVSPGQGHEFGAAEPQVFTIRATDPDGDAYVGDVTVRNALTNQVVTTFATAPAASGSESSGTPAVPLGAGSYTWTATASDPAGSGQAGPASASRGFTVDMPLIEGAPCTLGDALLDGYVADSYLRVASDVSGDTAVVCLRFDDGTIAGAGGELTVTAPEGASLPVISTSTAVCDTAGSEPVPQPLLNGSIGDPAEPETYVRFFADVRLDGNEVSVCVKAGTQGSDTNVVSRAITITVPDAGDVTPDVNFAPYTGGAPLPAEASHDDVSQASAACQTATSGEVTRLLNLAVDGVRTYLYAHTDTDLARACVRVAGGSQDGGGTASIDTSGFPGVAPIVDVLPGVGPGDPDAPCSLQVIELNNPVTVHVHRSGTGDIPAALCTRVASSELSVQLGFEGDPAATPSVGFTPDT